MRKKISPAYGLLSIPLVWMLLYGNRFLYLAGAEFSDLTISHLPNAVFLRRALFTWGQIPLWSPGILSGFPFVANPLSGLFYPPGWLAVLWPEPWLFNLLAGLHLVWGGVGLLFLLQNEGVGKTAAIFGGLAFSLMPKWISHYGAGHISLVYAVSWTPWLLYASRTARRQFWPAVILALIFFADVRWAAFSGLIWGGWELSKVGKYACSQKQLWGNVIWVGKRLGVFLEQLGMAFALSAPLALPLVEFIRLSTRAALSVGDVFAFSLPPARLLGLLFPEFGGMQEWVVYPGGVVLALALVGWGWPEVRRKTRFWWGVWLVTVLFSLGENLPGLRMIAQFPGMSLLRVPPRAMFLAGMAMAVLAAFSLDAVLAGIGAVDRRRATRVLVALAGIGLSIAGGVWFLTGNLPLNFSWGAGMIFLAALGTGFALRVRQPYPVWVGFLLIGIGLLDWGVVDVRSLSPRPVEEIYSIDPGIMEWFARENEPFRVYSPSYSLPQHIAAEANLELADGVDPMQLASYSAFMGRASEVPQEGYSVTIPPFSGEVATANAAYTPDARLLGLLNVRYVVSAFDLAVKGLRLVGRFGEARVYENVMAQGRAWVEVGGQPVREAQVVWSPNQIEVMASGPGLLVLSEVVYPGWRVKVDGQDADLLVAEGLLRAVKLPDGNHHIKFEFRPVSLFIGWILFGVGCLWFLASARFRREGV